MSKKKKGLEDGFFKNIFLGSFFFFFWGGGSKVFMLLWGDSFCLFEWELFFFLSIVFGVYSFFFFSKGLL